MRVFYDRIIALVFALGLLVAGAGACPCRPLRGRARRASLPTTSATPPTPINAVVASGSPLAATGDRGAAGRAAAVQRQGQEGLHQDQGRQAARRRDRQAGRRRAARRSRQRVASTTGCAACIDAALGGLTLMAPDPNRRYDAAQAVFKSRDAERAAGARQGARHGNQCAREEGDDRGARRHRPHRRRQQRGRQDRRHRRDPRPRRPGCARPARRLAGRSAAPTCARPRAAASAKIQSTLAIWNTVQNAWYGLSLGSVLLLAAIGLAITFGVMGVINMAHGEMVMLGAYTTFVVQELIRTHNPALFDYSLAIARAARLPGLRRGRHHRSSAPSSASSTAGRWRRCSPPGACR